jgi:hypothetical protein
MNPNHLITTPTDFLLGISVALGLVTLALIIKPPKPPPTP